MSLEKFAVVIPARMASTRLPGKVMKDIHGEPLIWRVYQGCLGSEFVDPEDVFVITPDVEIVQAVRIRGGRTVLTGPAETVLSRCSQAAAMQSFDKYDWIIVVQGDEPMVVPEMIDHTIRNIKLSSITCLVKEVPKGTNLANPNMVKVVMSNSNRILYMSRAIVPGITPERHAGIVRGPVYKQVCVMAILSRHMKDYNKWPIGPLERAEGIDQLRYLENDVPIKGILSNFETYAVDTEEDLERVRRVWNEDRGSGL